MNEKVIFRKLSDLYNSSKKIEINDNNKIVIFSDLHIGNGGNSDDFRKNSTLFEFILKKYYLKKNYTLILNGDIEELYKFHLKQIVSHWKKIYDIFYKFFQKGKLIKILGNHDYELNLIKSPDINSNLYESIILKYDNNDILIFHGHQASNFLETYNRISRWIVRYIVTFLRLKGQIFLLNSKKIFVTEQRCYKFTKQKKIISIIGHTHKPLFESTTRKDDLKYRIELLIRRFSKSNQILKNKIQKKVNLLKSELKRIKEKEEETRIHYSIFNDGLIVPCLFNSGTVIGKRGLTAIEICKGKIKLVYWFNINNSNRYINNKRVKTKKLKNTDYYKGILKQASLKYIFAKIKLIS